MKIPISAVKYGPKLKRMRQISGETLRQVETVTGISNAYLSQLETGKVKEPGFRVMMILLRHYGYRATVFYPYPED